MAPPPPPSVQWMTRHEWCVQTWPPGETAKRPLACCDTWWCRTPELWWISSKPSFTDPTYLQIAKEHQRGRFKTKAWKGSFCFVFFDLRRKQSKTEMTAKRSRKQATTHKRFKSERFLITVDKTKQCAKKNILRRMVPLINEGTGFYSWKSAAAIDFHRFPCGNEASPIYFVHLAIGALWAFNSQQKPCSHDMEPPEVSSRTST